MAAMMATRATVPAAMPAAAPAEMLLPPDLGLGEGVGESVGVEVVRASVVVEGGVVVASDVEVEEEEVVSGRRLVVDVSLSSSSLFLEEEVRGRELVVVRPFCTTVRVMVWWIVSVSCWRAARPGTLGLGSRGSGAGWRLC